MSSPVRSWRSTRASAGQLGDLGFPTSSEADGGLKPASRMSTFAAADRPVIFWTPDHGAVIVRGAMNAAWAKLGGATGRARGTRWRIRPRTATSSPRGSPAERSPGTPRRTTSPPIRRTWRPRCPASRCRERSHRKLPSTPSAASDTGDGNWLSPQWWWLLVVVPVLLVLLPWGRGWRCGIGDVATWRNTSSRMRASESLGRRTTPNSGRCPSVPMPPPRLDTRPASGQDYDLSAAGERVGLRHRDRVDTEGEDREDQVDETPADDDDEDDVFVLQDDPDAVDTAPTRIESDEAATRIESDDGGLPERSPCGGGGRRAGVGPDVDSSAAG